MKGEMKRSIGTALLGIGLALAVACGSDGGAEHLGAHGGDHRTAEDDVPLLAARAVATPTAAASPSLASGLQEQMDQLVLDDGDVPARFFSVASMSFDLHIDFLNPTLHTVPAQYTMFVSRGYKETITCTVALVDDPTVEKFFSQTDHYLNSEGLQAFSDMAAAYADTAPMDFRELDLSGLGDMAWGYGLTTEVPGEGVLYNELVFFGHGSLMASVQTTAVGGAPAVEAVPLAQKMAEKITAVIR